jgi:hypothetical protein
VAGNLSAIEMPEIGARSRKTQMPRYFTILAVGMKRTGFT